MARFLLLLSPRRDGLRALGPREIQERTERFRVWIERGVAAGVVRGGAQLGGRGQVLKRGPGGRVAAESTQAATVTSFLVVEADDERAALAVAAGCPGADPGTMEIVPIEAEIRSRPPVDR